VHVAEKGPEDRDALHDDSADDLGGVPNVRVCVAPEIPYVFVVAFVFPASADGGHNGDDHSL
jgi:hypothetical protein